MTDDDLNAINSDMAVEVLTGTLKKLVRENIELTREVTRLTTQTALHTVLIDNLHKRLGAFEGLKPN